MKLCIHCNGRCERHALDMMPICCVCDSAWRFEEGIEEKEYCATCKNRVERVKELGL